MTLPDWPDVSEENGLIANGMPCEKAKTGRISVQSASARSRTVVHQICRRKYDMGRYFLGGYQV